MSCPTLLTLVWLPKNLCNYLHCRGIDRRKNGQTVHDKLEWLGGDGRESHAGNLYNGKPGAVYGENLCVLISKIKCSIITECFSFIWVSRHCLTCNYWFKSCKNSVSWKPYFFSIKLKTFFHGIHIVSVSCDLTAFRLISKV